MLITEVLLGLIGLKRMDIAHHSGYDGAKKG